MERRVGKVRTRISKIGPWSNPSHGFTLFEILVVLALIGFVTLLVWPIFGSPNDLRTAGRRLIGAIQQSFLESETTRSVHRLYYDLDEGKYWLHRVGVKGEEIPASQPLEHALPSSVRFHKITTLHRGEATSGQAFTQFFPVGRTERTLIQLVDTTDQQALTLILNPLTGDVRAEDGLVEKIQRKMANSFP